MIALVLLSQIFRPGRMSHLRIQGAIAVYLLFGVIWAHAYHIVAILQRRARFTGPIEELTNLSGWAYYSYRNAHHGRLWRYHTGEPGSTNIVHS